ncbi:MAG: bifunctional phosphoribosyl-AMP cyclohydrolase/phosphoribosyl-ATP diphosphatase HisIE [Bacteroidota bacterium]
MTEQLNFEKMGGLVPAVIQDAQTGQVLMVGFMNKEALQKTSDEKRVTFWSRTKKRLWQKGETSGNYLEVVSIHSDCDTDAVLIKANPHGPVCHTGSFTCFGESKLPDGTRVLAELESIIAGRKINMPEGSYTAKLFAAGTARIAQKVGEEGVETALAAVQNDNPKLAEETADLLYHIIILLRQQNMTLADVADVLRKRMK